MVKVDIQLPSVLDAVTRGERRFSVEATTLKEALEAIKGGYPEIALHFFDEQGDFRPHVLCFLNGTNTRWFEDLNVPLNRDAELLFMQAVSGG